MARRGVALGSFDVFHVGHLRALRRAVQLCDQLVIAVAADELVESRRGARPVVELAQRFEIVESFALGAEVVTTEQDTVMHLVDVLGAEIAFVAGDDAAPGPSHTGIEDLASSLPTVTIDVASTTCETLQRISDGMLLWSPTVLSEAAGAR